jgi:4-hydroxy-4-methyl-2-oxoglutarate aldolase
VTVEPGETIVGEEEGIVVVPKSNVSAVLKAAKERAAKDASESLVEWERAHRSKIEELLSKLSYQD